MHREAQRGDRPSFCEILYLPGGIPAREPGTVLRSPATSNAGLFSVIPQRLHATQLLYRSTDLAAHRSRGLRSSCRTRSNFVDRVLPVRDRRDPLHDASVLRAAASCQGHRLLAQLELLLVSAVANEAGRCRC